MRPSKGRKEQARSYYGPSSSRFAYRRSSATAGSDPPVTRSWAQTVAYIGTAKLADWLRSGLQCITRVETSSRSGGDRPGVPRGPDCMIPGNATFALEKVLSAWARNPAQFETRAKAISDLLDGFTADLADRDDDEALAARLSSTRSMPFGLRCGSTGVRPARMALEEFQQNKVDAAYLALCNGGGSSRFLIADEVGLGKTICSKGVAQRLKRDQDDALNAVYLCPNLDIAS